LKKLNYFRHCVINSKFNEISFSISKKAPFMTEHSTFFKYLNISHAYIAKILKFEEKLQLFNEK